MKEENIKKFQIHELRKAVLNWYPFEPGRNVLLFGDDTDVFSDLLGTFFQNIICVSSSGTLSAEQLNMRFDYVIVLNGFEKSPEQTVKRLHLFFDLLAPDGVLLIGFRNRWGVKYLCGGLDNDVQLPYSGIANQNPSFHLFARSEMSELVKKAGFSSIYYYYLMPDPDFVQAVYTDEFLPKVSIRDRVFPFDPYKSPFLMCESDLYDDLVREQMLPYHVNYYLAECRKMVRARQFRHVIHAALSTDRGPEHGFATVLYSDGTACKKVLSPEGMKSLSQQQQNLEELRKRGIPAVDAKMTSEGLTMPLVWEDQLMYRLQKMLHEDQNAFLDVFEKIMADVLSSSDKGTLSEKEALETWGVDRSKLGMILKKAYIDMIPYNAFWVGGRPLYYDQEFTVRNCPALYVMFRALRYTWIHIREAESIIPLERAKARFKLTELWDTFLQRENAFVAENRNYQDLEQLYAWANIDRTKIMARREKLVRMNAESLKEESLVRDVHTVQLRLIKAFVRVCEENGLRYMAIHGTLLGTVRHHGFIPWDDDIDVAMPREDYDRLLALGSDAFTNPFFLQTPLNNYGCYYGGYSKLRYGGTAALEPQNAGKHCHQGIWIDIFPLDNCPYAGRKRSRLFRILRFLQRIIYTKAYGMNSLVITDVSKFQRFIYMILSKCARRQDLIRLFDRLCRGEGTSGERAILACYYGNRCNRNIWPETTVGQTVPMPFEDIQLPVPGGWEKILSARYGADFMAVPPEEKRRRHWNIQFYPNLESLDDGA